MVDKSGEKDVQIVKQQVAAKMCPIHDNGEMTKTCVSCAAAFSLIKDQNIIAELSGDLDSDSLLSRYKKRCDTITPSLTLASSTIQLAVDVFNKGELHDQVWTDLVRKFLRLNMKYCRPIFSQNTFCGDTKMRNVSRTFLPIIMIWLEL